MTEKLTNTLILELLDKTNEIKTILETLQLILLNFKDTKTISFETTNAVFNGLILNGVANKKILVVGFEVNTSFETGEVSILFETSNKVITKNYYKRNSQVIKSYDFTIGNVGEGIKVIHNGLGQGKLFIKINYLEI
ncbi:MAG: hypothetical protein QXX03_08340 [Nitrososphaerota archaeon]